MNIKDMLPVKDVQLNNEIRNGLKEKTEQLLNRYPEEGTIRQVEVTETFLKKYPKLREFTTERKPFWKQDGFKTKVGAGISFLGVIAYFINPLIGQSLMAFGGVIGGIGVIHGEIKAEKKAVETGQDTKIGIIIKILQLILQLFSNYKINLTTPKK